MKESGRDRGNGSNGNARSATDKEKSKMRERRRRSITTNIFHGLRKHGGYRLSPRADINEVLRNLAQEAGWIVEPDGTTYRSLTPIVSNGTNPCPRCGGGRKSATPTPTCSFLGTGGGQCSTTASPRRVTAANNLSSSGLSSSRAMVSNDSLLAIYMCGAASGNACTSDGNGKGQQLYLLHEATLSNQNTPAGSPPHRT